MVVGSGVVKLLAKGATVIANTTHNVNGTVTLGFTTRKTGVTFASLMVSRGNRGARGRVTTLNMGIGNCTSGTTGFRSARGIIGRVGSSFNSISVLMGGTKVAGSNLVVHVDRTR